MHYSSYEILEKAEDFSEFKFISKGPHGDIVKLVIFEKLPFDNLYNLALVDVVNKSELSDTNYSNNDDLRKILATTIKVLIEFTSVFPDRMIFFKGSDNEGRRNSLYHRAITQYYLLLAPLFFIEGITNENTRENFNPENKYDAFLAKRR